MSGLVLTLGDESNPQEWYSGHGRSTGYFHRNSDSSDNKAREQAHYSYILLDGMPSLFFARCVKKRRESIRV